MEEKDKEQVKPENSGIKQEIPRNPDGTFPSGISGNPKGKPKGTISVVSVIKELLKEITKTQTGDEKERLRILAGNIVHMAINEKDKDMIKLIVNYLDGMPKQTLGFDDSVDNVNVNIKMNGPQPASNDSISEKLP